ncbi:hypothetical protein [Brevundimonas sp. TWP2-3-4b2]|uniref:hypothetical protein n=1 Tax=Brevundimonas sp. TWP2-3-4b2 TaxID=2804595 RepID=UPI003CF3D5D1
MKPQISEFSYGFALTNELVAWEELSAAPVFPSLLEEGRPGGGYDVKLERPGVPLYLQFKRSEFLTRRSGREARELALRGQQIGIPYYRFAITEDTLSQQHEMLVALDVAPNFVFYAAPRFHRLDEINDAWHANAVASRSQFVAPHQIGLLPTGKHTVAFDGSRFWVCSEPRSIEGLNSRQLADKLRDAVKADDRPFGEKLPELAQELASAEERGRGLIAERRRRNEEERAAAWRKRLFEIGGPYPGLETEPPQPIPRAFRPELTDDEDYGAVLETPEPAPVALRTPKPLTPERRLLREVADRAARSFDCQLVIVQPHE